MNQRTKLILGFAAVIIVLAIVVVVLLQGGSGSLTGAPVPCQGQQVTKGGTFTGNLTGCKFDSANLAGTNFTGADLTGSTFLSATLTDTNFSNATLYKAKFTGAKINAGTNTLGAKWCNTTWIDSTVKTDPGATCP